MTRGSARLRRLALAVGITTSWAATPSSAAALDPARAITQYVHDHWQAEDGLPGDAVWAVVQTRDGYLWLGTSSGLVRFDGVHFTLFNSTNTPALRNDEVRALALGRDGSLWIGSYGGGLVHLADGRFTAYGARDGLPSDVVYNVSEGPSGDLWIATAGGLVRMHGGRFRTYTVADGLPTNVVYTALEDRAGRVWIGTYGGGLSRLQDGHVRTYNRKNGFQSDIVLSLYEDRAGRLWVGTYGGGLVRMDRSGERTFTTRDGLTDNRITDVREDRDGSVWVATYAGGVDRLSHGRFTAFGEAEGLTSNSVMRLYESPDGSIWIGTRLAGVNRLREGRFVSYTRNEGLSDNMVYATYQDTAGRIWIATEGGGLDMYSNGAISHFHLPRGLKITNLVSLMSDAEGMLWAGTVGEGAIRIQPGSARAYTTKDGLPSNTLWSMQRDRSGAMWFGTMADSVARFQNGRFESFGPRDGLGKGGVRVIYEDPTGALWFGTNGGGLSRFQNGRFSTYTRRNGLGGDIVFSLLGDPDGTLWIGTKGSGLTRLRNGRFSRFTMRDGLGDNSVFQLLSDASGNLWLCGNRGLARVSRRSLNDFADGRISHIKVTPFGRSDGMKRAQCNGGSQPGAWRTADGHLWFPTSRGVVVVNPNELRPDGVVPWVYLEETVVDDKPLPPDGEVRLDPGARTLEFHYTGISSLDPADVTFRYKLEGFDDDWVDAGGRRVAYYTNVPPGRYRFRVVALNRDGVVSGRSASMSIEVAPHFYATLWFYALGALVLLATGTRVYRMRVSRLQARERELYTLVAERTRELEEATERLEQLTRSDSLTGVSNRRHFDEVLSTEWRRAMRSHIALAIVMVDIDCFKRYNDAYGHVMGDECVRLVAVTLQTIANRAGSVVARYGGEEFVILLPGVNASGAMIVAERMRVAVEGLAIPHRESDASGSVTISAGVAAGLPTEIESAAALLALADRALYRSKHTGRNRVCSARDLEVSTENQIFGLAADTEPL